MTAFVNGKAYGPLSIISQALGTIQTVAKLPPHTFWPRPAVDSVMIRMDVGQPPIADHAELRRFVALVRGVFDHRRKTLRSALKYVIREDQRVRVCLRFDATRRPESFSVPDWLEIFRVTNE